MQAERQTRNGQGLLLALLPCLVLPQCRSDLSSTYTSVNYFYQILTTEDEGRRLARHRRKSEQLRRRFS